MHPSDLQLEAYANRTLGPVELLAVDDHLAACDACRGRAADGRGSPRPGSEILGTLLPAESHLTEAQVVELAEGPLPDALADHLRACAACAREVHHLRAWTRERPRVGRWAYAAAAAVAVAILMPALLRWPSPSAPNRPARSPLPGLDALTADDRQRVQAALDAGVAEPPAFLADLEGRTEALMGGASPGGSFRVLEPLGTVSVSDRPAFRWEALAGARSYTVSVFDEALRRVTESPPVTEAPWIPAQPFPRGRVYVWQVSARRTEGSVAAPAPPAPMAKFRVMEAAAARTLERLARERPDAHLLLGILYTQAGARAQAARHLAQVPPGDPYFGLAERTRARLQPREPSKAP